MRSGVAKGTNATNGQDVECESTMNGTARATALKRVPGATIVKQEIEEVLVDAITGAVVSVEHEDD